MLEFIHDQLWLEVIILVAGITTIYIGMHKHRVPTMTPLGDRAVNGGPPAPLNKFEADLQLMGFRYCGDYEYGATTSVKMALQGYVSDDWLHCAVVAHVETEHELFSIIEFSTDLTPFGNLSTNTNRIVETFRYPLHKVLAKVPWKKSAREVYGLHLSLCEVARTNGYEPKPVEPSQFAEEVRNDSQRDLEYQVRKGIMVKIGPGVYRLSLVGAILGVPKVWYQMTHGALFFWYRRDDETFRRRLQRRFDKIRAIGYTPD